jgi:hypothetical protein
MIQRITGHSQDALKRIREADAELKAKQFKDFVPEKNESAPMAYFEIGRYTKGPFRGMFLVHQLIVESESGKPLKNPVRKLVIAGVDMVVAMSSLETALRRRVFK